MSNFTRRPGENEGYIMNQQVAVSGPYGHAEGHEFGINGSGPYHFPQHSFNPYGSHFGPSYGQQYLHQCSSEHSMSTPDDLRVPHPPQQYIPQPRYFQSPKYMPFGDTEVETQESRNDKLSEPVMSPLDGFPNVKEFDHIMQKYLDELSPKKQDKALIHAKRARNILAVLRDPKDTAVESAQFRFWVKKMFKLQMEPVIGIGECREMICHEKKPVAIREKLFKILTRAHQQCQHGGRDKTSAQVRRRYSWVPKELISRFVKSCPTCQVRRGGSRLTPPNSRRGSPRLDLMPRSPKLPSPPISRRDSTFGGQVSVERSQSDYFGQLHSSNGWLDSHQSLQGRPAMSTGAVRSYAGPIGNLSQSIQGTLDPFSTDLSVPPSQLSYAGYVPALGPNQRDF